MYDAVFGRVRWRIRNVVGIIGMVVFTFGVIIIGRVIVSDFFTLTVCDFKASGVVECHTSDHLIDPDGHLDCLPFIACGKAASL